MNNSLSPKMDFGGIAKTEGVTYNNSIGGRSHAALTSADFLRILAPK